MDKWDEKLVTADQRLNFAILMLKQVLQSLRKLHRLGYSHGDLKPANICARQSHDGSFKFTLIDLGMSMKLAQLGDSNNKKVFRGNLMFASIGHIVRSRPSQLDDIYSLLCVAYYFFVGTLPWIDYIERLPCNRNYYVQDTYVKIRLKKREEFDKKLC